MKDLAGAKGIISYHLSHVGCFGRLSGILVNNEPPLVMLLW